jgi:peptide/nickel transport system substrate-binding protein
MLRIVIAWLRAPICLVLLCLAAPLAAKDTLTIGISQFPRNFNPHIEAMLVKSYILSMAQRPFIVYDADWKLKCMLCVELPSLENGGAKIEKTKDGKLGIAITYTIRPDAVWGDGVPVTAKDVVFTWNVGRDKRSGFSNIEPFQRITSIDVHSDKKFTVHASKFTCDYQTQYSLDVLPAHIEAKNFADPAQYRIKSAYETDTTNPGLWYGPYRITEVVSGSHVVLEPNPTWWGKKPAFKRIIVKAIEKTSALTANLLSGDIDYIAGEAGLTVDEALALEPRTKGKYKITYKPGLIYEHIDLNLDNPILKDRNVRRALLHAIDRVSISAQLFEGHQPVAHGQTNPLDTVYDKDVPQYVYDPEKAKQLLQAAGWSTMRKGIRYNAKGERLQLDLMTTAGNKSRELIQQVLQSHWRRVGVDIRIRNEPARVLFGETISRRKFRHMTMYAWISAPKIVPRTTLHSTMIPSPSNGWSGQNYPGFANPAMDKALDDAETVCETKPNRTVWQQLQRLYAEELPALPLYFRANPFIIPNWLKGITPTGHQFPTTLWIEDWRVAN